MALEAAPASVMSGDARRKCGVTAEKMTTLVVGICRESQGLEKSVIDVSTYGPAGHRTM